MFPAIKLSTVALIVVTSLVGTAAITTYEAGAVHISVQEKHPGGDHVKLIVPAVLVPVGMHFIPQKELQKQSKDLRQYLPVVEVAAQELEKCPDATFVEVISKEEHVSIRKSGDAIVIDVDDRDETVHVSFPVRTVEAAAHRLEASLPPV